MNAVDYRGCTALMLAMEHEDSERSKDYMQLLLDAGTDVNIVNQEGDNHLLMALKWGINRKISELLLGAGSDVKQSREQGEQGETALNRTKIL